MAARIGVLRKFPLKDDELDAVLFAADEEVLGYVRAAADPEAALLKIMAAGDNDSVPPETPGAPCPPVDSASSGPGCGRVMVTLARIAIAAVIIFAAWCSFPRSVPQDGSVQIPGTLSSFTTSISFAPHRYGISSTARTRLSVLLERLKIGQALNITISAYTDGSSASGQALANERAEAIQDWLAAARVAPDKLHTTTLVAPHQDGRLPSLATVSVVLDELKCRRISADGPP